MKKSIFREYFESLVIAVILALFVRTWVFQAFKIPTGSMEKGLLVGDHLIVNKMVFAPTISGLERGLMPDRPIRRGDVVVFKFPKDPERDFIKRVIGLPGERLEVRRKKVLINGKPIDEPYVQYLEPPSLDGPPHMDDVREEYGPVTVPDGQYFMMGDNRDNSEDSRFWGFMPKSYVKGEALFMYFSFNEDEPLSHFFSGIRWGRMLKRVR
jgi:signal peptidase I